jgi:HK97 family phage major capsid protein
LLAAGLPGLEPEGIVIYEIGRDCSYLEENAYCTGDGVLKPLGMFTASNDGIGTTRDYVGSNTATALHPDTLIKARYKLKPQYRKSKSCGWLFHRDALGQIMAFKDGNGQYVFRYSEQAGTPDTVHGINVYESEFVPNTFTTGLYVGLLGDLSQYWVAEMLGVTIQRRIETYAGTNQDGFLYRRKLDGQPMLGEAFVRLQLG